MSEVTKSLVKNCAKNVRVNTPKGELHAGHDAAPRAKRSAIDGFESRGCSTSRLHGSDERAAHSYLSVLTGSRRVARRAGKKQAPAHALSMRTLIPARVAGSVELV